MPHTLLSVRAAPTMPGAASRLAPPLCARACMHSHATRPFCCRRCRWSNGIGAITATTPESDAFRTATRLAARYVVDLSCAAHSSAKGDAPALHLLPSRYQPAMCAQPPKPSRSKRAAEDSSCAGAELRSAHAAGRSGTSLRASAVQHCTRDVRGASHPGMSERAGTHTHCPSSPD